MGWWILVLAGLLAAGCQERRPPARSKPATFDFSFPRAPWRLQRRLWYRVLLQGRTAGWHRLEVFSDPARSTAFRVVKARTEVRLGLRGQDSLLVFEQRALVDRDGHLLRLYWSESEQARVTLAVQAGRRGDDWVVVRGAETVRLPLRREAVFPVSYARLFGKGVPRPGERRTFVTFDGGLGAYLEQTLVVGPRQRREGRELLSAQLLVKDGSREPVQMLLDDELVPWHLRLGLGRLRLAFARQAGPPPEPAEAVDLSSLESVPFTPPWQHVERVERVLYRVEGLPENFAAGNLVGPGQRLRGHPGPSTFLVEVQRLSPPGRVPRNFPVPAEVARYLRASTMLPLAKPDLQRAAAGALGGTADAWQAARALRRFVSREIDSRRRLAFVPADQVLAGGYGDCAEQSILLAALLRVAGIPARAVLGLVWRRGAFWKHMWVEAWLAGAWYPLDPAQERDSIDVRWIRLGWLPLGPGGDWQQRRQLLAAFASGLKVEVVEFQQGG